MTDNGNTKHTHTAEDEEAMNQNDKTTLTNNTTIGCLQELKAAEAALKALQEKLRQAPLEDWVEYAKAVVAKFDLTEPEELLAMLEFLRREVSENQLPLGSVALRKMSATQ